LPLFLLDSLNVPDSEDLSTGTRTPPGVFFSERDVWSSFERKATPKSLDLKGAFSCGSVGHPHTCAAPCRYVKKQGGCRDGANCSKCHLCFWHRKSNADDVRGKKVIEEDKTLARESESEEMAVGQVPVVPPVPPPPAPYISDTEAASVGTRGHPFNCGQACKYFRRKGGCRDGAACLNCHECRWRRDVPTKQGTNLGLGNATTPGFDKSSTETLQKLIYLSLCGVCDSEEQDSLPSEIPVQVEPSHLLTSDFVELPPGLPAKISVANDMNDVSTFPSEPPVDLCSSIGSLGHPHSCGLACKYASRPSGCKDGRMCSRCHICRWQRKQEPLPQNKRVGMTPVGPPPGLF